MPFIFFMGWMLRFGRNLGFRTTHPRRRYTRYSTVPRFGCTAMLTVACCISQDSSKLIVIESMLEDCTKVFLQRI